MTDSNEAVDQLIERDSLERYLSMHLGDGDSLEVERHQQGHSNETLFVTWNNQEMVLRRPPLGSTDDSAHNVLREYRVMSALQDTEVPVPSVVLACDDESIIGTEFFLIERLNGDVIRTEEPQWIRTPSARKRLSEELLTTLISIHKVDPALVGLEDFGSSDSYLQRQVEIWRQQLEDWLLPKTSDYRELPYVQKIGNWLSNNVPEDSDRCLVHGDFKLDNVMYASGTPPNLIGVFDWEMSTLGDPLADLGWLLTFWKDPDDPEFGLPTELSTDVTSKPGYPTRENLIDAYEQRTGREFVNRRFYRVLNEYKITVACEAMYLRYVSDGADDPMYPLLEDGVPSLARRTNAVLEGRLSP